MGKRIISQNRGRGSHKFRAIPHKYRLSEYGDWCESPYSVVDVLKDRYRVILKIVTQCEKIKHVLAPRGVNTRLKYTGKAVVGQIMKIGSIPLKSEICAFQMRPNGPAVYKRAPGTSAAVIGREYDDKGVVESVIIRYGSGKLKKLDPQCFAIIGIVAGGDMRIKPFLKAGTAYRHYKSVHKRWPIVRGVAMNIYDHPFGGSGKKGPGRSTTPGRKRPPGAKVGSIAASRTGGTSQK